MTPAASFIRTTLSLYHPHPLHARRIFDLAVDHGHASAYVLGALTDLVDAGEIYWRPEDGYRLTDAALRRLDDEVAAALT